MQSNDRTAKKRSTKSQVPKLAAFYTDNLKSYLGCMYLHVCIEAMAYSAAFDFPYNASPMPISMTSGRYIFSPILSDGLAAFTCRMSIMA